MLQLLVDTARDQMFFGLLRNRTEFVDFKVIEAPRKQSDIMIQELHIFLESNNVSISDIIEIICCIGPGSFVGVRVGLTFAKILSTQFNLPLTSFTSLESMKQTANCIVVLDAKGKKYYVSVFSNNESALSNNLVTEHELKVLIDNYPQHRVVRENDLDAKYYQEAVLEILENRIGTLESASIEPLYLK